VNKNTNNVDEKNLDYYFLMLSDRHKECLHMYAKLMSKLIESVSVSSSSSSSSATSLITTMNKRNKGDNKGISIENGIFIDVFYQACVAEMIVKSMKELDTLLKELCDHNILKLQVDDKKKVWITITLPLQTFIDKMKTVR
jgi:hypothetical protein